MPSQVATPLWGGAVEAVMPPSYIDISNYREVPSHQEFFVDTEESIVPGASSALIFEIVEYQTALLDSASHSDTIKWHWSDLAKASEFHDTTILDSAALDITRDLPVLLSGKRSDSDARERRPPEIKKPPMAFLGLAVSLNVEKSPGDRHHLRSVLGLIRLPSVDAEIIIVNHTPCQTEIEARNVDGAYETVSAVMKSMCIIDWSLFGEC